MWKSCLYISFCNIIVSKCCKTEKVCDKAVDDTNFDKDDPETIIHVRLTACKQGKACNEDIIKELKPAAWDPTRWWDWYWPENKKKQIKLIFTDKN